MGGRDPPWNPPRNAPPLRGAALLYVSRVIRFALDSSSLFVLGSRTFNQEAPDPPSLAAHRSGRRPVRRALPRRRRSGVGADDRPHLPIVAVDGTGHHRA